MDNNLSKNQYINTRVGAKKRNADIYPVYEEIKSAKKACYPGDIKVTETRSEVPLQSLLNHTSERVFSILHASNVEFQSGTYKMIHKWGMDGTSDQSRYKQAFRSTSVPSTSESWSETR